MPKTDRLSISYGLPTKGQSHGNVLQPGVGHKELTVARITPGSLQGFQMPFKDVSTPILQVGKCNLKRKLPPPDLLFPCLPSGRVGRWRPEHVSEAQAL